MVIVGSFSYLSLITGLLLNVLSVDGSAADIEAIEDVSIKKINKSESSMFDLPSEVLGTITRFLPEKYVYNLSTSGNKLLTAKMRQPEFYQTNSTPMLYNLANPGGAEIDYIREYLKDSPKNSSFKFHLTHFTQPQLETIFSLFNKNESSVTKRASAITRAPHWNRTANILKLSNIDRDAWNLSDLIQNNNEEVKKELNNRAQSENLQDRETVAMALSDLFLFYNNTWARERINNFVKSQNIQDQQIAVMALMHLVLENNGWAKETFSNFAQSQNVQQQQVAALVLRDLVLDNNDWAKKMFSNFAQSQNVQQQQLAALVLRDLMQNNKDWAMKHIKPFAQKETEIKARNSDLDFKITKES